MSCGQAAESGAESRGCSGAGGPPIGLNGGVNHRNVADLAAPSDDISARASRIAEHCQRLTVVALLALGSRGRDRDRRGRMKDSMILFGVFCASKTHMPLMVRR
jgi:hypothetical protein